MIIGIQMGATSGCAVFERGGGGVFYMLQVKRDLLKRKMIQGIQAERLRMRF